MDDNYDVVVVGGGAAGLSAALTLGRALRSTLVVDAGEPRNGPADHIHNYLGREGATPAELLALGRAEVASYGGRVVPGTVVAATRDGDGFVVTLDDGTGVRARRLLVTSGLVDELPAVAGLAERWGRDVLHCPYCHGWEVRGRRIGVLGPVHQALLLRQWSTDVTLVRHTRPEPSADEREQLAARGIPVVDGEVRAVVVEDDRIVGLELASGERVPCDAVAVLPRFTARSAVLTSLGLETVELELGGHVLGTRVPAEPTGATAMPGVYVAGDVSGLVAGVITTAAAINADLVAEDTRLAVEARTPLEVLR